MNKLSFAYNLLFKNRKLILVLLYILLSGSSNILNAQTLVWQDNFDSATLNNNNWTYDFGNGSDRSAGWGWGNSELEYYTSRPENVRIEKGNLVIEARNESFGGNSFTSGRIKTEGRIHFMYGTIEARIKMPNVASGLWPALWTLGTVGEVWPQVGEIDILEMGAQAALAANKANEHITGAMHWNNGGSQGDTVSSYDNPTDLSADYHVYKMVWTSTNISMYIDSTLYFKFDISNPTADNRTAFHTPHYLLLNLAIGGNYPSIFSASGITAPLPADMLVDYVKLYQNPGDSLYIGTQHASTGNFGVYTETTPLTDSITIGNDATLNYWNNLTNISNAVPYEGKNVLAVEAKANDWFGFGISNRYVNLSNYDTGSLKFQFKSSYKGQFKFGVTTAFWQSWVNFAAGVEQYGLIRDGNWHQVSIPLSAFNNPDSGRNIDLMSLHDAFMFAGDPATGAADFYIDNIYFSGGKTPIPLMSIGISSPVNDSIVGSKSSVTINTLTSANVKSVAFYSGSTLLDSTSTAPFSYVWSNPTVGTDTLIAVAKDSLGNRLSSAPVIIFVSTAGNKAPTVSITSPSDTTFLTPASITINATANDSDGSIYKVEFYAGTVLLGTSTTSPYSFTWTGATPGNYVITVKATDNGGLVTTSSPVNIAVKNPILPTIIITSPASNSSFNPASSITIEASAADSNSTIAKVDFYSDTLLLGTSTTSPYSFTWNNVSFGTYSITAKATATDGYTAVSAPLLVSVSPIPCTGIAQSGDYSYEVFTYAGTVYFKFHPLAPIAGSSSAIIYLATGGSGTYPGYGMASSGKDFVFTTKIADGTITSFYFTYSVPSGGQRNSSANPHSYLVGSICAAGAPTVSITSPAAAAAFTAPASISFSATASSVNDTITKVEFYNNTTLIGTDTVSPYNFTWTGVAVGSYSITAKATNGSGISATSIPVNVIVNAPNTDGYCGTAFSKDYEYKAETKNGVVTITMHPLKPIAGSQYALVYIRQGLSGGYGGTAMTAVGSDFIYTLSVANGTSISFYFTYQVPSGGEHNSSANPNSYVVGTNCTGISAAPPVVSIVSPTTKEAFTEPASIAINVSAVDTNANGKITEVDIYNGSLLLGKLTDSPFVFNWDNVPAGNYTLSAKAFDNNGLSSISSVVNVVVNIDNSMGFCGTLNSGDFSYRVQSSGGKVTYIFHPLAPIAGCSYVFIYARQGVSGGYPGYAMTAVGQDFTYTQTVADSTPISVYFTYQVPAGGERNSIATPISYTAGSICGALPVSLSSYTASLLSDGTISIAWKTAAELNNNRFVLEKSTDGIIFTTIATVNNSSNNSYKVIDTHTVSGINYYRLVQIDNDGKKQFFAVKSVTIAAKNNSISVYPNPLNGSRFTINFGKAVVGQNDVQLVNITGNVLFSGSIVSQGNLAEVNLSIKPEAGIYVLKIKGYNPIKLLVK